MSNLLRSLMMNEKIACFFWANSSFALLLTKNEWFALKNMTKIVYFDTLFKKNEQFAHSLFFYEQCEQITQVTHQKWVMWANCSGGSPKMSHHEWVAHQNDQMSKSIVFRANRSFAHYFAKKSNSLRKPMSKFPTQEKSQHHTQTIIASGQALILADQHNQLEKSQHHTETIIASRQALILADQSHPTGEESASHTDHHSLRASINTSRPFTTNWRRVSITHRPS